MLRVQAVFGHGMTTNILINSSMSSAMVMNQASLDVGMTQQDIVTLLMLLLCFVKKVNASMRLHVVGKRSPIHVHATQLQIKFIVVYM